MHPMDSLGDRRRFKISLCCLMDVCNDRLTHEVLDLIEFNVFISCNMRAIANIRRILGPRHLKRSIIRRKGRSACHPGVKKGY